MFDMSQLTNGQVSYWMMSISEPTFRRDALTHVDRCDVAIVGAGFSGLWVAYYLKKKSPSLDIVVLEREFAGFGASGRNGGWLSSKLSLPNSRVAAKTGREAVIRHRRLMVESVDEVIRFAAENDIDADIRKSGFLQVATNAAQLARARNAVADARLWGQDENDLRLLSPEEAAGRVQIPSTKGGIYSPNCARIQPAKLVRGLAEAVERQGVRIYEDTPVVSISSSAIVTERGRIQADVVLRCTEGFSAHLPNSRRQWAPMNSAMIITEPLPGSVWRNIGWRNMELIGNLAHAGFYSQRTRDGRIALGGRGVPYRFASRIDREGRIRRHTIKQLCQVLEENFPSAAHSKITHAWCGVIGVPRDWCATVNYDRRTGFGTIGGYVGHGVTATNLAARCLSDLVLNRETELAELPWVNWLAKDWEPEPFRWAGIRSVYALYRAADRMEARRASGRTAIPARIANWIARSG